MRTLLDSLETFTDLLRILLDLFWILLDLFWTLPDLLRIYPDFLHWSIFRLRRPTCYSMNSQLMLLSAGMVKA